MGTNTEHRKAERHQEAERQPNHPLSTSTPLTTHTRSTNPLDGRYAVGVASCEHSINRVLAVPKALTSGARPRTTRPANFFSAPLFHRWEKENGHMDPLTGRPSRCRLEVTQRPDRGQGWACLPASAPKGKGGRR
jgi:hypothetical protein